jgi:hypothetical protein
MGAEFKTKEYREQICLSVGRMSVASAVIETVRKLGDRHDGLGETFDRLLDENKNLDFKDPDVIAFTKDLAVMLLEIHQACMTVMVDERDDQARLLRAEFPHLEDGNYGTAIRNLAPDGTPRDELVYHGMKIAVEMVDDETVKDLMARSGGMGRVNR